MAADAFRAGAAGYVYKISPVEELIKAVFEVSQGRGYVTSLLAADLIHSLMNTEVSERSTLARLTPRQREVLQVDRGRMDDERDRRHPGDIVANSGNTH